MGLRLIKMQDVYVFAFAGFRENVMLLYRMMLWGWTARGCKYTGMHRDVQGWLYNGMLMINTTTTPSVCRNQLFDTANDCALHHHKSKVICRAKKNMITLASDLCCLSVAPAAVLKSTVPPLFDPLCQ